MRRLLATAAVLACTLVGVAACGGDQAPATASDQPKVIEITFSEGTVTPNGERVEVKVGQKIELVVKADSPGEIHVHSTPEHEFTYSEGTTTLPMTIDKPGVVDVESHELGQVIVQLQVE